MENPAVYKTASSSSTSWKSASYGRYPKRCHFRLMIYIELWSTQSLSAVLSSTFNIVFPFLLGARLDKNIQDTC